MMGYYEPLLLETMTLLSRKFCLDDKCFRKGFVWVFPPLFCFLKRDTQTCGKLSSTQRAEEPQKAALPFEQPIRTCLQV